MFIRIGPIEMVMRQVEIQVEREIWGEVYSSVNYGMNWLREKYLMGVVI